MGTLVLTESGYKNIEEIKEGDIVIATDPETGKTEVKEVKRIFENKTFELVHLTVNGETIVSTPGHKYYAPEKGWVSAIELRAGDLLQLVNGEYVVVEAVQHEILEEPVTIYNFEVEDFHTYYVGEQSVLVHNRDCNVRSSPESYYTYNELKKLISDSGLSGRGVGFEAHHLLEKQYAGVFGVSKGDIISVPLTPQWHRGVNGERIIGEGINLNARIEDELMNLVGVDSRRVANRMASPEQIWLAHKKVYEGIGQSDWAAAIYEAYVRRMGINY